jgi:hypothetical protein
MYVKTHGAVGTFPRRAARSSVPAARFRTRREPYARTQALTAVIGTSTAFPVNRARTRTWR